MQTIDLFSGQKSFSKVAGLLGLNTFTVDIESKFNPDLCIDILDLNLSMLPVNPEIVWASPDCTTFSIASGNKYFRTVPYKYRKYDLIPKCEAARSAVKMIEKTIQLIFDLNPDFYYIENPRGLLNHLPVMKQIPFKTTVYYMDYGHCFMKPTDIWHNNPVWISKIPKHKYSYNSDFNMYNSCSKTNRSVVPKSLILEILNYTLINYENYNFQFKLE